MSIKILLGFSDQSFAEALALKVSTAGVRPADAVENLLAESLVKNLYEAEALSLCKQPSINIYPIYFKERCVSLSNLAKNGYQTWYVEIKFSTYEEIKCVDILYKGLGLRPIDYGTSGSHSHRLSSKKLKTKTNNILRLNHLDIPPSTFGKAVCFAEEMPRLEQPFIANPRPGPRSNGFEFGIDGFEFASFDHVVTGERQFCACAKYSHLKMLKNAKDLLPRYVDNSWPQQVVNLLTDANYREDACHLCIVNRSGLEAAVDCYGDALQEFVVPYTNQLILTHGIDKATARSEVQKALGLSRWIREAEMYSIVKELFPKETILREASPTWLGRQRLDVFLPNICLAIEYQGEQHYRAIKAFGGDLALQRNIERDSLKRQLCEENAVHLVEIRYDEPLTLPFLRQKLQRFIGLS
jgi:hypothetical protein